MAHRADWASSQSARRSTSGYMRCWTVGLVLVSVFLTSCAASPSVLDLREIPLGSGQATVASVLGQPAVSLGCTRNCYGQMIETWEYRLGTPRSEPTAKSLDRLANAILRRSPGALHAYLREPERDFWLHFFRGRLVHWCQAHNWQKEVDLIYLTDFAARRRPQRARLQSAHTQ